MSQGSQVSRSDHGSVFQQSGVSDLVTRSPKELTLTTELKSCLSGQQHHRAVWGPCVTSRKQGKVNCKFGRKRNYFTFRFLTSIH